MITQYLISNIYRNNDNLTSFWFAIGQNILFVQKNKLIWIAEGGRTIMLPQEVGQYFFFENEWFVWVQETGLTVGRRDGSV